MRSTERGVRHVPDSRDGSRVGHCDRQAVRNVRPPQVAVSYFIDFTCATN
jgi:hypothetical protein